MLMVLFLDFTFCCECYSYPCTCDVCFFDDVMIGQRFKRLRALDNIFNEITPPRNYSVRVCLIMTYAIHAKHNFKIRLNGQPLDVAVNVCFVVYTQVTLRADVYC